MTDKQAERIAELIKPLRVKPGSKVNLAKDFGPGYKAGYVKKKHAKELMRNGIALLRLPGAAGRPGQPRSAALPPGAGCRRQGRHDPPCHERGEPAGRARHQF